jgi:hypothetical protein
LRWEVEGLPLTVVNHVAYQAELAANLAQQSPAGKEA